MSTNKLVLSYFQISSGPGCSQIRLGRSLSTLPHITQHAKSSIWGTIAYTCKYQLYPIRQRITILVMVASDALSHSDQKLHWWINNKTWHDFTKDNVAYVHHAGYRRIRLSWRAACSHVTRVGYDAGTRLLHNVDHLRESRNHCNATIVITNQLKTETLKKCDKWRHNTTKEWYYNISQSTIAPCNNIIRCLRVFKSPLTACIHLL